MFPGPDFGNQRVEVEGESLYSLETFTEVHIDPLDIVTRRFYPGKRVDNTPKVDSMYKG